ncbi:hypothetical protein [Torque teno desmodus rotundus virus]|nr:hypothetical protein [Torque teno desmodus rotundus virus]
MDIKDNITPRPVTFYPRSPSLRLSSLTSLWSWSFLLLVRRRSGVVSSSEELSASSEDASSSESLCPVSSPVDLCVAVREGLSTPPVIRWRALFVSIPLLRSHGWMIAWPTSLGSWTCTCCSFALVLVVYCSPPV